MHAPHVDFGVRARRGRGLGSQFGVAKVNSCPSVLVHVLASWRPSPCPGVLVRVLASLSVSWRLEHPENFFF